MITGVHTAFQEGNVFAWCRVRAANWLDRVAGLKASRYIQKPFWDCLPCMASVWGMLLTLSFDVPLLLAICGMLTIIDKILSYGEESQI